jgi:hypothetical protein
MQEANNDIRTFEVGSIDAAYSGFLFCAPHIKGPNFSVNGISKSSDVVLVMFFDILALFWVESAVVRVRLYESANTEDRKWRRCSSVVAVCARDDKIASWAVWLRCASRGVSEVVCCELDEIDEVTKEGG